MIPSKRLWFLSVAGLVLALGAPFAWLATLSQPLLRSSALAGWTCALVGVALAWFGARRAPSIAKWCSFALTAAFAGLFALMFFGFTRLPQASNAVAFERAFEFELPDHEGRPVRLADEFAKGPVLLVFYRGSW